MKKKAYMKPQMEVVKLEKPQLLAGSAITESGNDIYWQIENEDWGDGTIN